MEKSIKLLEQEKRKFVNELKATKEEFKKYADKIKGCEAVIADLDEAIKKLKPKKK